MAKIKLISLVFILLALVLFSISVKAEIIGTSEQVNQIVVESQTYIDEYFNWQFTEIDNNIWIANFTIEQALWNDTTACLALKGGQQNTCFQNLCNNYFSDYFTCDNTNRNKLRNDLQNVTSYSLRNLTSGISFSDFQINLTSGTGSFNIIFPEGFKTDESAEFGFGSTVINTTTTVPYSGSQRPICKDGAGILHVAWRYDSNTVAYANSSDGTTWNTNLTIINAAGAKTEPHISCDGNNITVAYEDSTADDIIVYKSENNGESFTQLTSPVLSGVTGRGITVERRGQNIYIAYETTGTPRDILFVNSTDGGDTWGQTRVAIDATGSTIMHYVGMAVDGNGSTADKLYVAGTNSSDTDIWFVRSTDSGVTWSNSIRPIEPPGSSSSYFSLTFSSSNLYLIVADGTNGDIYISNSSDGGATWNASTRIDLIGGGTAIANNPSITIDNNDYPRAFWRQNVNNANYDIVYRSFNGTAWNDSVVYLTNDNLGNNYENTPYTYYNDGKIHFVWRNGTASPFNIMYNFISVADTTKPTFSNNATNSTVAGSWVNHSVVLSDDVGLSYYNFEFDNGTGTLTNITNMSISGTQVTANQTVLINSTVGVTIRWRYYFNDTSNNWNVSILYNLTTTTGVQQYSNFSTLAITLTSSSERSLSAARNPANLFTTTSLISRTQSLTKLLTDQISVNARTISTSLFSRFAYTSQIISDKVTKILGAIRTPTHSFSIDSVFEKLSVFVRSGVQSLTVNDVVSRFVTIPRSVSQVIDINDAVSSFLTIPRSISQAFNLNQVTSRLAVFSRSIATQFTVNEYVQRLLISARSVIQSLFVNDAVSRTILALKSISQSLTVDNIVSKFVTVPRTISQSINVNSLATRLALLSRSLGQTFNLNQITARIISFQRSSANTISIETLTQKIALFSRSTLNSLNLQQIVSKFTTIPRGISQSLNVNNVVTRLALFSRSISQTFNLNQIIVKVASFQRA